MTHPIRSRLRLQSFEERIVPAFNMTIDGDFATSNIVSSFNVGTGTRTFTATASGANLNVGAIETALNDGENVIIQNGSGGADPGLIEWSYSGNVDDDLDYGGTDTRSLAIITDATTLAAGGLLFNGPFINASNNLDVIFDLTAGTGNADINMINFGAFNNVRSLSLLADGNIFDQRNNTLSATKDVLIVANVFFGTPVSNITSFEEDVTINAKMELGDNLAISAPSGTITTGTIDGGFSLSLRGETISTGAIGATTPLDTLVLERGTATFGNINANGVAIGIDDGPAVFNSSGVVTADVFVNVDGFIAPGGSNAVGTLTINGKLTLDGGAYDVNLAATPDKIVVNGDVDLFTGTLENRSRTGALPGTGNVQILAFTGTLSGEFDNAPLNTGLILGADAVQVTNYGPDATGITIAPVAATPGNTLSGADADGTLFKVALKGGGTLTTFKDVNGAIGIVADGTTAKSSLNITTMVNGSDNWIFLGDVRLNGAFGTLKGGKTILVGDLAASGNVKGLQFLQTSGTINVTGSIGAYGTKLASLASMTATSLGKVTAGLDLTGGQDGWNITNGIASIAAGAIDALNLTAKFIGTVAIKQSKLLPIQPNLTNTTITLTGNDGTGKQMALKALTVAGTVDSSTFDIEEGNVGAFTVGRFTNSVLWLDYSPDGPFSTNGTFDSGTAFKLASFTTTAKTLGDPTNENNWAFNNSEIVADTIGKVTLSGLKTDYNGLTGGIKFRTTIGNVRVATADSGLIPLNTNLTPAVAALAGDFFLLNV